MKPMFRSSTWMVTVMTVVFWMVTTASPAFTSPPSAMVQEMTVPSMGAVALRASTAAWASLSRSWAAVSCSSRDSGLTRMPMEEISNAWFSRGFQSRMSPFSPQSS